MQQHALRKYHQLTWWLDILILTIVVGILYFSFLGERPLFVPDEGRYAEIIREMLASNDYITPHLNGIKYFEKPVLFYWLGVAASKLFSLSIGSLRFINTILGWAGCILVYFTGRQLYDRRTGWLAASILATSLLYFAMAHIINLDMTITFFLSLSLCMFLLGTQTNRRYYFWLAGTGAALAVLTKGLIGLVFPLLIIGSWVLIQNKWHELKRWHIFSILLVFLLIALPWHLAVQHFNPEFFHLYIIEQHFLRFTDVSIGHYQPFWYFIPCLCMGFFPWIAFLPQTIRTSLPTSWQTRKQHPIELYLLLWAGLIFLFFSFSKSKLISYILPVLPPLALLTAHYLRQVISIPSKRSLQISWFSMVIFAAILACGLFIFLHNSPLPDAIRAKYYVSTAAIILAIGMLLSGVIGFRHTRTAIIMTVVTLWLFLQYSLISVPTVDTRTILPLAQILKPMLQTQDEVITYNQYFQDLPFYLERKVTILNWQNELAAGMRHQDTRGWMIKDNEFWQRWHSSRRVYVIMSRDEFDHFLEQHPQEKLTVLGKTINNILIVNQEQG